MRLWKEGKIKGLFLSSSILKDPDYIAEKQLNVLRILRGLGYKGYIHLRLMPGTSRHYMREAVELADRVGVNLEAPTEELFEELCPSKGGYKEAVLKRLEWVVNEVQQAESRKDEDKIGFGRSGVDTQMIVGAVGDTDWQHLKATMWLYESLKLKRVYYSGFEPVEQTPFQDRSQCPPHRGYRLYQCSFLIRDYGFKLEDLVQIVDDEGFLPNMDPKVAFAMKNLDLFPVDLNEAAEREIMRIPQIGPLTANRIVEARKNVKIKYLSDLEKIVGANLARAVAPYIDLKDKRLTYFSENDYS
jgi:predicted DNA-binding helix-hairpin-helix protein